MTEEEFQNWFDSLPILTYGEITERSVQKAFLDILIWKQQGIFISDKIPDNTYTVTEYWLYLGLLNDCIEYGSSPRGAWLTDFGLSILIYLLEKDANGKL